MVALDEAFDIIKAPGQALARNFNEQVQGAFGNQGPIARPPMAEMAPGGEEETPEAKGDKKAKKADEYSRATLRSVANDPYLQDLFAREKDKHNDHGRLLEAMISQLGPPGSHSPGMSEALKFLQAEKRKHEETQSLMNSGSTDVRHTPHSEGPSSLEDDVY